MTKIKLYDTAYPGSMCEREEGDYVRADDSDSLAALLLRNIRDVELRLEDWKHDSITNEKSLYELLEIANRIPNWIGGEWADELRAATLPYKPKAEA